MFANISKVVRPAVFQVRLMSGEGSSGFPGSGAGKGGGGGGSIRDAGGAFGKMEAAREDQWAYNKSKEELHELHEKLEHEHEKKEEEDKKKSTKK